MGRTVSALVTSGEVYLGAIGPFDVDIPWWSEVEPVVAHLRRALGVPVLVLRLLQVDGGEGGRDGHVTYHVEALRRPAPGLLAQRPIDHAALTRPEELRSPWARMDGLREVLGWASDVLAAAGRPLMGPVEQRRTWNLAGLFRLPTDRGPVWLKTTPHFAADEAEVIAAFARLDPSLVPTIVHAGQRRILLEHLPGQDCWEPPPTSSPARYTASSPPRQQSPSFPMDSRLDCVNAVRPRSRMRSASFSTATSATSSPSKNWPPHAGCSHGGPSWTTAACPTRSCTATSTQATGAVTAAHRS
jgi:hypothetical protein